MNGLSLRQADKSEEFTPETMGDMMPKPTKHPWLTYINALQGSDPRLGDRWIPCKPECVGSARRFVRDLSADWGVPREVAETAELLTCELVTNGIRYGGPDTTSIRISIARNQDLLTVAVQDMNPVIPEIGTASEDDTSGRGLGIVALLADDFGWSRVEGAGKVAWFDLKAF